VTPPWLRQEALSPFRRRLVTNVFNHLDSSNVGSFPLDLALSSFDASKHPTASTTRRKPEDVLRDMHSTLPWYCGSDGVVTLPVLEAFYSDVSFGLSEDDEFQLVLWNCWGL
jgi:hypothetical protein